MSRPSQTEPAAFFLANCLRAYPAQSEIPTCYQTAAFSTPRLGTLAAILTLQSEPKWSAAKTAGYALALAQ
ncbi:Uncharacterised protein [Vibrio cholerae]|nr:Uncharacterised protein [Vibrio cholerae]CSB47803.1 Uncharacterised protein [Vibrio cholerae]CSC16950.1 Uncharacterised protein [Vibrio cholerae]CSC59683.1 Uncharacterised protein [Vibrio cholerae]